MKREIKFRCWNGNRITDDNDAKRIMYNLSCGSTITPDWYHIMQYTGLKDKNGVEIYEGDVVLHRWNEGTEGIKKLVQFKDGAFGYSDSLDCFISYAQNHWFEFENGKSGFIEVIGNIYQNPELLNPHP